MHAKLFFLAISILTCLAAPVPEANYDEAKVGAISLPEPLTMLDGAKVKTADDWKKKRRPEVLELFQKQMFGRSPGRPEGLKFEVKSTKTDALNGLATR